MAINCHLSVLREQKCYVCIVSVSATSLVSKIFMVWEDRRLSLQGKRRCWGDWGWLQKQRKEGWSHEVDLLVWTIVVFWSHALCIHATISSRAPRQATSAGHIWLLQTSNDWGNFPCLWSPPSPDWINLLSSEGLEEHLLTSLGLPRIYGTKLQLVFKTTVIFYLLDALLFFPLQSFQYCPHGVSTTLSVVALFLSFMLDESWLRIHFLSLWV